MQLPRALTLAKLLHCTVEQLGHEPTIAEVAALYRLKLEQRPANTIGEMINEDIAVAAEYGVHVSEVTAEMRARKTINDHKIANDRAAGGSVVSTRAPEQPSPAVTEADTDVSVDELVKRLGIDEGNEA